MVEEVNILSVGKAILHCGMMASGLALLAAFEISTITAATMTAASCSSSAVQAAINAAASRDTVAVPAGTCSWSSAIQLPPTKDLTILGAGADRTVLTCSSGTCFNVPNAVTTRISGFTFNESTIMVFGAATAGKTFRIDHNKFTSGVWRIIDIVGEAPARHPTGLVDNNAFLNFAVHVRGTNMSFADGPQQHQLWAEAPPLGGGTGVVYIEANAFTGTLHQNAVDGNYGARLVFRFNTLKGTTYAEIHSVQGSNRAVQMWEIYNNNYNKSTSSWYPVAFVRGGTGVIFGNRASANYTNGIILNNVRSCRDPGGTNGKCAGSSNWDQNSSSQSGYACRDQIGRGRDTTVWSTGAAYNQPPMPAYFWDNTKDASTLLAVSVEAGEPCSGSDLNRLHILSNRDFYSHASVFTGTAGVGMGTLASRPTTCTPRVAYWVTDQAEWNRLNPGPDGQLYVCSAPNMWTLYYTPYSYPHPLAQTSRQSAQWRGPTRSFGNAI